MKKILYLTLMMIVTTFCTNTLAADWRFPLEISYVSGYSNVVDYYEMKTGVDASYIPVGLSFGPYVQLDHGSMIGGKIGPLTYISVDCIGYCDDIDDETYLDIPIYLYYGFAFIPGGNISPYVKGGLSYHIISADSLDKSTPGFYGAIGVEFMRNRAVGLGLEVAYDTAEVTMKDEYDDYHGHNTTEGDFKPGAFMVTFSVIF